MSIAVASSGPDSSGPSSSTSTSTTTPLTGDSLVHSLRSQLDFYFSKENLQKLHTFLISQMNPQKWVSIDVICGFRKVKSLTEDRALVVSTMKTCKNLIMDLLNLRRNPI